MLLFKHSDALFGGKFVRSPHNGNGGSRERQSCIRKNKILKSLKRNLVKRFIAEPERVIYTIPYSVSNIDRVTLRTKFYVPVDIALYIATTRYYHLVCFARTIDNIVCTLYGTIVNIINFHSLV